MDMDKGLALPKKLGLLDYKQAVRLLLDYGIVVLFLLLVLILSFTTRNFMTTANVVNVLLQSSIMAVMSIGVTFVIIIGGIDVSVGSLLAISSAAGVGLIKLAGAPWWLGMSVMILTGLGFGMVNGAAVSFLRMPAFLVTLSMMAIGRGLTLVLSGGKSWYNLPEQFGVVNAAKFLGLPILLIIVLILYLIGSIVLGSTIYGRKIYAVGGNSEAARVSGIKVKLITMSAFMISGLTAGIASLLQTARLNSFWAEMGTGFELRAIAAVVIGGTSLTGGVGTLWGTLIGVLLMGVINNALNLLGVPSNWQDVARGGIIFVAVMLDAFRTRYVINE